MNFDQIICRRCKFFKGFFEEFLQESNGPFTSGVDKVFSRGTVLIDDGEKALQEYQDCHQPSSVGLGLKDWIVSQIEQRKVVLVPENRDSRKDLRDLGVPQKDQKWVFIACGGGADLIASEDIDLVAPKLKFARAAAKIKIKQSGKGPVSRFLKKTHGIRVACCATLEDVLDDLDGA